MKILGFTKSKKKEKKSLDIHQDVLNKLGGEQFSKLLKQGIQIQMGTVAR